jgi:hypothetical protein
MARGTSRNTIRRNIGAQACHRLVPIEQELPRHQWAFVIFAFSSRIDSPFMKRMPKEIPGTGINDAGYK